MRQRLLRRSAGLRRAERGRAGNGLRGAEVAGQGRWRRAHRRGCAAAGGAGRAVSARERRAPQPERHAHVQALRLCVGAHRLLPAGQGHVSAGRFEQFDFLTCTEKKGKRL